MSIETLQLFTRLWPICRSIVGPGFRESLDILSESIPFKRLRIPSGTQVFDWVVPNEWSVADAYIVDPYGKKRCDFKENNLHLVSHSIPFKGRMSLEELRPFLHTQPNLPGAIPYRTSYYKEQWGFCLSHDEFSTLPEGDYEVVVDTKLTPGHLEIGELVLPGKSKDEILLSTYLCHPSMANNELSGPLVMQGLYQKLLQWPKRHYTYRFVVLPETIGSLAYLSVRGEHLKKHVKGGCVLTCLGFGYSFTYKPSKRGDGLLDHVFKSFSNFGFFDPTSGSDERQYCSPAFDLPVGALMARPPGHYREYHTSFDNAELIDFRSIRHFIDECERRLKIVDQDIYYRTLCCGEPQLGKYGFYPALGGGVHQDKQRKAMMWLLSSSDGCTGLRKIAEISETHSLELQQAAEKLVEAGLLERC